MHRPATRLLAAALCSVLLAAIPASAMGVGITSDGGTVAFDSKLPMGVADDTNGAADVFLYARGADATTLLSRTWTGGIAAGPSTAPVLSADGAWVAFVSSKGLAPTDRNPAADVFLLKVGTPGPTVVSLGLRKAPAKGASSEPSISGSGGHVAFTSTAANLVAGDSNGKPDVFLSDRARGTTVLVSRGLLGKPANGPSSAPVLSANGRHVVFVSKASNLVPRDTNGVADVFAYEVSTKRVTLVSRGPKGKTANGAASEPSVSADGATVAFLSQATNVDPTDRTKGADAYVVARASGTPRSMTRGALGAVKEPALSPDGRTLALRAGTGELVTLASASTAKSARAGAPSATSVPGSAGGTDPSWSGDGSTLAFRPAGADAGPVLALWKRGASTMDTIAANGKRTTAGTTTPPPVVVTPPPVVVTPPPVDPTPPPAVTAPTNTVAPSIPGGIWVRDQVKLGTAGTWTGSPTFAYQWERCTSFTGIGCVNALGAGSTALAYTLAASDVGGFMRLRVTATNSAGSASATSSLSSFVAAPGGGGGGGPTNTAPPSFGVPISGSVVTGVNPGTWSGTPTFTYTWRACTASSGGDCFFGQGTGATTSSYAPSHAEAGMWLQLSVTATSGGSTTATSSRQLIEHGAADPAYDNDTFGDGGAAPGATNLPDNPEPMIVAAEAAGPAPVVADEPTETPVPEGTTTTLGDSTEFLYTGPDAVQTGVTADMSEVQAAVVNGTVVTIDPADDSRDPLPGVRVRVLDHPEFGHTTTTADGSFAMAINGGGEYTFVYELEDYAEVQRTELVEWQESVVIEDVVMTPFSEQVTELDLNASVDMQVAQGPEETDADGSRTSVLMVEQGTDATMTLPDGTVEPLDEVRIRMTEYTAGGDAVDGNTVAKGDDMMPGSLPATSGYTYAADFTVDQALREGADLVTFDQPLINYTDNFLGFPVGSDVPTGYYDKEQAAWVPSKDGRVIEILAEGDEGGVTRARMNTDSDPAADTMGGAITDAERERLAQLYDPGTELWRVEIAHFTPWDHNWPYGPPAGARGPELPGVGGNAGAGGAGGDGGGDPPPPDPCNKQGSIINCQTQTLGEHLPVQGTGFSLTYDSSRVPGRSTDRVIEIPVANGQALPPDLIAANVTVEIAGQRDQTRIALADLSPNEAMTWTWDGRDGFGREVYGTHVAKITVGYEYKVVYRAPGADFQASFGALGGSVISADRSTQTLNAAQSWSQELTNWDVKAGTRLGGWGLSVHHLYDPVGKQLLLGDGRVQSGETSNTDVISTIAGNGTGEGQNPTGDGGPAIAAQMDPSTVAVDDEGRVYVGGNQRIRRIDTDGVITTIVGGGAYSAPASVRAQTVPLDETSPQDLQFGPDGKLYWLSGDEIIWRLDEDGKVRNAWGYAPPTATNPERTCTAPNTVDIRCFEHAPGSDILTFEIGPDGTFYVGYRGDNNGGNVIMRGVPGGPAVRFAGDNLTRPTSMAQAGSGIPALQAKIGLPSDIEVMPDGDVLFIDAGNGSRSIRRIDTDGTVRTVASASGTNSSSTYDGIPVATKRVDAQRIAVDDRGMVYVSDRQCACLYRFHETEGTIKLVAGRYRSNEFTSATYSGEGGPAQAAQLFGWWGAGRHGSDLALAPSGALVFVDKRGGYSDDPSGVTSQVRQVSSIVPGVKDGQTTIASADGQEVFVFDEQLRHVSTIDALTNQTRYTFAYAPEGWLSSVTDHNGRTTTIQRSASGSPTSITAAGGQQTLLGVTADGWLTSVENEAGETTSLTYDTPTNGLLETLTTPAGVEHTFGYDAHGRLVTDAVTGGTTKTLSRSEGSDWTQVALQEGAGGPVTTYRVTREADGDIVTTTTEPSGAVSATTRQQDGTVQFQRPDGTTTTSTLAPDPRFGMQAPYARLVEQQHSSGAVTTTTQTRTRASNGDRTVTRTVEGATSTITWTESTRTLTATSPSGRAATTVFDGKGRPTSVTPATGIAPTTSLYDVRGRLTSVSQADQSWTYTYDASDRIASRTADGEVVTYGYDDADRMTWMTLPGGRTWQYTYDADGNRTSTEMPGGQLYTHTVDGAGRATGTVLPGGDVLGKAYDASSRVSQRSYPGAGTETNTYANGRLTSVNWGAEGTVQYTYDGADRWTQLLRTNEDNLVVDTDQTYSGAFETGVSVKVGSDTALSAAWTWNDSHELTGINVTGGSAQGITRDADGRMTSYGPFTVARGGVGGSASSYGDGTSVVDVTRDTIGRSTDRTLTIGGTEVAGEDVTYDERGWITERVVTNAGGTDTYEYTYDGSGRLLTVELDGALVEEYQYSVNGNRTSRRSAPAGQPSAQVGSFDAQDRLTTQGGDTWTWDLAGFAATRSGSSPDHSYDYTRKGELEQVDVEGGAVVEYASDGIGRRVRRTQGTAVTHYLYANPANPFQVTASRHDGDTTDGTAAVLTTYFYDEDGRLFALTRGANRYTVATDHVGSPVAVFDAGGTQLQAWSRDSYGVPTTTGNSGSGFDDLAVGFAGGIPDATTGLVRFGFRDYDPLAGRWLARDPSLFAGSPDNLYAYVGSSPVTMRDPSGLSCIGASIYLGIGGGFQLCSDGNGNYSSTVEAGLGVGGGVEVNPWGTPGDPGSSWFGELGGSIGPIATTSSVEYDRKCKKVKVGAKAGLGPVAIGAEGTFGDDFAQGTPLGLTRDAPLKIGASGKVGGKATFAW